MKKIGLLALMAAAMIARCYLQGVETQQHEAGRHCL